MRRTMVGSTLPLLATALVLLGAATPPDARAKQRPFTDSFMIETCDLASTGANPYFPLTPGHQLVLESDPDRKKGPHVVLVLTVLDETFVVDGVTTRVVEERETEDGVLAEISRNYFAHCVQTGSVFYFGEDVDNYDDTGTTVLDHDGSWHAGVDGARPGLIMPGQPLVGARYFQEIAPGVAEDRAEITSVTATVETPAGTFDDCVETKEGSALERKARSFKAYAPNVGLIVDDDLTLTSVGTAN